MATNARYELNNPPVIAELVEGEVIAINLDNGSYYSLVGPSVEVWNLLLQGHSAEEILRGSTMGDADGALEGLARFIEALVAEQLLRPAHPPKGGPANGIGIQPCAGGELRFDRFTDMQDLLLLDPIHEVEKEVGWPKPSR